jgi:hypothetical protein
MALRLFQRLMANAVKFENANELDGAIANRPGACPEFCVSTCSIYPVKEH